MHPKLEGPTRYSLCWKGGDKEGWERKHSSQQTGEGDYGPHPMRAVVHRNQLGEQQFKSERPRMADLARDGGQGPAYITHADLTPLFGPDLLPRLPSPHLPHAPNHLPSITISHPLCQPAQVGANSPYIMWLWQVCGTQQLRLSNIYISDILSQQERMRTQ